MMNLRSDKQIIIGRQYVMIILFGTMLINQKMQALLT